MRVYWRFTVLSQSWLQAEPGMAASGEQVVRRLEEAGFQAYFVGGCVRDELMGRSVHDMDITTSALPEQVMELFERTVPTGLAHGTVTVLLSGYAFEVTTFRKESGYADHRRPTEIDFVDRVEEDLLRRDFTMNAIARNLQGLLIDPYRGRADIEQGWIRCVGEAKERFAEDALRMLRAVRFASVFGFMPLKSLWQALLAQRENMSFIAIERIRAELERIIQGPNPLRGLALLQRSRLLATVKAPLPSSWESLGPDSRNWTALTALPADEPALRWSLLLEYLSISPEDAVPLLRSWTFPGVLIRQITALLDMDLALRPYTSLSEAAVQVEEAAGRQIWIRLELTLGKEAAAMWLKRESILADKHGSSDFLHIASGWHNEIPVHQLKDLAVSAGEVMGLSGRKGGPWLGDLMKELLYEAAAGHIANEKSVLLEVIKERLQGEQQQQDK